AFDEASAPDHRRTERHGHRTRRVPGASGFRSRTLGAPREGGEQILTRFGYSREGECYSPTIPESVLFSSGYAPPRNNQKYLEGSQGLLECPSGKLRRVAARGPFQKAGSHAEADEDH